ncbi:MAG: carbohydrate ABC transporter permease [Oscillospiraceae bacterium]|jgi:putative aldouronate transport system permease protein|nr:carbohydrate ABC transporter permease [Oscillospiraceae bacterium]
MEVINKPINRRRLNHVKVSDVVIAAILIIWGLVVLLPFINVVMISFTTEAEYASTKVFLFPKRPTLASYQQLLADKRIATGYKNTLTVLLMGIPLSLFCTASFAYGSSRPNFPGRKFFFYFVLFTMLFSGGIIPMYMLMKELGLTNTLWSVVLASTVSTFYMIIMRNFFTGLPDSLIESAKLDGAGDWLILWRIILPLSMPIMATITLFYTVDRWNEWYNAMIFLQKGSLQTLQLVLRSIVLESRVDSIVVSEGGSIMYDKQNFTMGLKTAAIIITMLPVMLVFPFLQKHFVKGVLVGAIKS